MPANQRESAGQSWEIYGDPTPNPTETETVIVYLLQRLDPGVVRDVAINGGNKVGGSGFIDRFVVEDSPRPVEIERTVPARDDHRRDPIANQVRHRSRLRHESIDAD